MTMPPDSEPAPQGVIPIGYASVAVPEIPAEWTGADILGLREEEFGPFVRLMVMIRVVFGLLIVATMVAVFYFAGVFSTLERFLIYSGILLGVMAVANAIRIGREVSKLRRVWRNFRVIVAEEGMMICHGDRPPLRIERGQVSRIVETWDSFRIHMGVTVATLPKRIDSPERVRARLETWKPIERGRGSVGAAAGIGWILFLAVGNVAIFYVGFFTVDRGWIVGCLVATSILTALSIIRVFRERTYPRSVRIRAMIQLLLPAVLIWRLINLG